MVSTLLNGLVSYWKLDTNNATQPDEVGGNDGTVTGATFTSSGKIGGAYSFDGTGDYINIATTNGLDTPSNITISAWIKTSDLNGALFDKRDSSSDGYGMFIFNGYLHLRINANIQNSTGTYISDNVWHYVVATYDGTYIRLYVDGTIDDTPLNIGLSTINTPHDAVIGYLFDLSTTIWNYIGLIDEVAIWNRALTTDEITELFNGGEGNQYPFTMADSDNAIFHSMNF